MAGGDGEEGSTRQTQVLVKSNPMGLQEAGWDRTALSKVTH